MLKVKELDRDREIMRHSDIKFDEGYLRAMSHAISKQKWIKVRTKIVIFEKNPNYKDYSVANGWYINYIESIMKRNMLNR